MHPTPRPPPLPPTTNLLTIGTHASEILQHIECHERKDRDSVELSEDDTGNESEADTGNESEDETGNANELGGISDVGHPGHDLNSEAIHHQVNDKLRHDLKALLPRLHGVKSLMEQTSLEESEEMAEFLTLIEDFHTFRHMRPSALRLSTQRQFHRAHTPGAYATTVPEGGTRAGKHLLPPSPETNTLLKLPIKFWHWYQASTPENSISISLLLTTTIWKKKTKTTHEEMDRRLKAQAAQADRVLRDVITEADEDRAVLEHQLFRMRTVVQDTERQLKETKAGLDVLNADVAGLR
ncbi:hypothetical protein JB92DRAFT_3118966 [Gautieria morchelliformis]|nr:hypothetical protein JB92DRAFT_3118966 [Gautieria morchelliformis]